MTSSPFAARALPEAFFLVFARRVVGEAEGCWEFDRELIRVVVLSIKFFIF